VDLATLQAKHAALAAVFTERSRRLWAATEARAMGRGGVALVQRATGMAETTIRRGLRQLDADVALGPGRSRQPGAGRKRVTVIDTTLLRDLTIGSISGVRRRHKGRYRPLPAPAPKDTGQIRTDANEDEQKKLRRNDRR
jgi:hypothetical protein